MEYLLQALKVADFEPILQSYAANGKPLHGGIDGGAGFGETAKKMLGKPPSQEDVDPIKEGQEKRRKEIIDSLYKQSG